MKIFGVIKYIGIPIIEEKECERITEKSVYTKNRRTSRDSWRGTYFETYKEACEDAISYVKNKKFENEKSIERLIKDNKEIDSFIRKMEAQ